MTQNGKNLPMGPLKSQTLLKSLVAPGSTIRADLPLLGGFGDEEYTRFKRDLKEWFIDEREYNGKFKKDPNEIKVVFIGDRKVGKTSLVRNYLKGYKLNPSQQETRANEEIQDIIQINDSTYDLKIIDMAGGYQKHKLLQLAIDYKLEEMALYANTDLFVFCYDAKDVDTLRSLKKYYDEVSDLLNADPDT